MEQHSCLKRDFECASDALNARKEPESGCQLLFQWTVLAIKTTKPKTPVSQPML